jgi:acetylornithine/succinyldiaminopimelate/putrescine aminotransferase
MRDFAAALAEQLRGFEFLRDVNVLGMTIGIETDFESRVIVRAAHRRGLRIEPAGDTAVLIQPPLVISDQDRQTLLSRLAETMEEIERTTATAELGVDTETE